MLLAAVLLVASALRIGGISATPLWGDEYGSITEATNRFGANLTSLPYSVVLRLFLTANNSVFVMRLPAALFGIAACVGIYMLGSVLVDRRTGLVAAALGATSAFAIGYSQEVRFYSLFLLGGALAAHSVALLVRHGPSRRRLAWLAAANLLCLAGHTLGALFILIEALCIIVLTAPPGRLRRRLMLTAATTLAAAAVLAIRQVREWGFRLVTHLSNANASYTQVRGIHLSNAVKVAWTYYELVFGERTYPLWWWLTVPGSLVVAALAVRSILALRRDRIAMVMVLVPLILAPLLMYFVLDAITSTSLQGAAPRYLIPLLAPFLIAIAAGITSWRSRGAVALSLLLMLAVNGAALAAYWRDTWTYNGYAPDWPRVAALVTRSAIPGTVVLIDGRTVDPAGYYWDAVLERRRLPELNLEAAPRPRIPPAGRYIVVVDTDRPNNQSVINRTLGTIQATHTATDGFVRYSLFVYVFDRTAAQTAPVLPGAWTPLAVPVDMYDIPLGDLALPISIRGAGSPTLVSRGATALSAAPGDTRRSVPIPGGREVRTMTLATCLLDDTEIPDGAAVATLRLDRPGGSATILLRKGIQVDDWERAGGTPPAGAAYTRGYSWLKLVSLVGQRAYPGAYRQFTAGIAVTTLTLPSAHYTRATLTYLASKGTLYVWAAAVR